MVTTTRRARKSHSRRRRGAALLLVLFLVVMVSTLVVNMLSTVAVHYSAIRNTLDYDRALYLANAGVHHACAQLEASSTWRDTVSEGTYPADDSYTASAVTAGSYVLITSQGAAGGVTRKLEATIQL
jgi:Tfp pilus assembly protein PilX